MPLDLATLELDDMYIKVPVEMALFSLGEAKVPQVKTYLAAQFWYSGNAHKKDCPFKKIARITDVSLSTVYRHASWLRKRNWFGKNDFGRYYFRGLDRIHEEEKWQFARAAIMWPKDLEYLKAYMAGVVCASLAETREGQRREQSIPQNKQDRSTPTAAPISISVLASVLNVSRKSAYRLRKLAENHNYIENEPVLTKILNWSPHDLVELKKQDLKRLRVQLKGRAITDEVPINSIRCKDGQLFLQEPNLITPHIQLNSRKGVSKYIPP